MEQIVLPVVRVRHKEAGGSGTVLYSDDDETFVLTNNHVVEGAVKETEKWDPYREKEKKREVQNDIFVEFFDWEGMNKQFAKERFRSELLFRDEAVDLALLKFSTSIPYEFTASAIDKDDIEKIKMFDRVFACGASLGHEPIPTKGHIMYLPEMIDNHKYVMSSSESIFGNSGGAEFRKNAEGNFEYIGVPSRLSVAPVGFSMDPQPHMSFFIHPEEIYNFLEKWFFGFLLDDSKDKEKCRKKRKEKIEKEKNRWAVKKT